MSNVIMCGILVVLILLLCLIFAIVGFLVGYYKILAKEPKTEPPPLGEEELAKMKRLKEKREREERNFFEYNGFPPDHSETI